MKKYWKCLKLAYSIGTKNNLHTGILQETLPLKKSHTIVILAKENDSVEESLKYLSSHENAKDYLIIISIGHEPQI